ncbi:hypothetical protein VZO05_11530 [Aggregatilineales bacterium SYSU G02658]
MKRLFVLFVVFSSVALAARAQVAPDARFLIADLGLELPVPSRWTYREGDGVYFAATDADIDAVLDDNPATVPSTPVIQMVAVQLQNPQAVTALPLRDAFNTAARQLQFNTSDEPLPSSVLGRLALTGFGTRQNAGFILTVWLQDERLVLLSMTTPDAASAQAQARAWGTILSTIQAVDALPLERRAVSTYGFEMAYPEGWTVLNLEAGGLFGVFETAADAQLVASGTATSGIRDSSVVVSVNRFEELRLTDDSPTTALQTILSANLGLTEQVTHGEFFVNGMSGTGLYGKMPNGRWLYVVGVLDTVNDLVFFYMLAAPTEARLLELQPTYLTMLHSTNLDLSQLPR